MKRMIVFLSVLICMAATSCRKELCYDHYDHTPGIVLDIKPEWELVWERDYGCGWRDCWQSEWGFGYDELCPEVPDGLRLLAFHEDGNKEIYDMSSYGDVISFRNEGTYSLLFHNNDTEYILFDGMSSSTRATATTRTMSRGGFKSMHEEERTIAQPDMLYGKYVEEYDAIKKLGIEQIDVTMRPLVYSYLICYEFSSGFEHVALARGALAGMAERVYLHDGHTGPESATILFDCVVGKDCVYAEVKTFGVPAYPGDHYIKGSEDDMPYSLNLEVRMNNGRFKTFEFDIREQMLKQPRGGVLIVGGLEITDEEGGVIGSEQGGGFDVGIDGWDDSVDIILPFD